MPKPAHANRYKLGLFISLAVIVVAAGAIFGFLAYQSRNKAEPSQRNQVNYDPPTKEEQAAGDEQKESNVKQQEQQRPATTANLLITNTSQADDTVRVRAIVSNAVENGGTCTATLTRNGATVSKQSAAFADASSTQCGALDFTRQEFNAAGTWNVSVTYKSASLEGNASGSIEIE